MFVGVQNLEVFTYWSIPSLKKEITSFDNACCSKQAIPMPKT